jgi:hypothetical protein
MGFSDAFGTELSAVTFAALQTPTNNHSVPFGACTTSTVPDICMAAHAFFANVGIAHLLPFFCFVGTGVKATATW